MKYGFSEDRARARRRGKILRGIVKWTFLLIVFGAIGYFAYQGGLALAQRDVVGLRQQVTDLTTQIETIQRENTRLETTLAAATSEVGDLRRRYQADVPTGPASDLLKLARERIAAGIAVERLVEVIGAVQNKRNCDGKPLSRRFVVRTSPQPTAHDSAAFADRQITATALGVPAVDNESRPQGWFDPAKPVTITFTRVGGTQSVATGVLPIHHSVVINDTEHRFVAVNGDARGFISVTSDSCAYP